MMRTTGPLVIASILLCCFAGTTSGEVRFLPGDLEPGPATGTQLTPVIAAGGGGYLTAWQDFRSSPFSGPPSSALGRGVDIYAQLLDASGATIGTVLDSPPISVFDLADEEFVGPYEVTAGTAGGVQLVWADQDCNCPDEWDTSLRPWDIHGKHVTAAGQIGAETALSRAEPAQTDPDLAAGPGQFLAVFQSESADVKRILAQRLDTQGNTIDAEPIEIASSTYATHPAVAWNGSVYMIVWDEFYYCVGGDQFPPRHLSHTGDDQRSPRGSVR